MLSYLILGLVNTHIHMGENDESSKIRNIIQTKAKFVVNKNGDLSNIRKSGQAHT